MSHRFTVCFLALLIGIAPLRARADMSPKAKAFVTVSGYGAASGALLGLASMAFGTSSRAIAQGASIGLYAGILFGTYILVSHHQRTQGYDDRSSPYTDERDDSDYGDYRDENPGEESGWSRQGTGDGTLHADARSYRGFETKKGGNLPPLRVNLLTLNF